MKDEIRGNTQNTLTEKVPHFTLQWHLTTACPNHCKHCYMIRGDNILSLEDCKKIVNDFESLLERWNCKGQINFSGGDPFLYPYFFELLNYTRSKIPELRIGILGNPELLNEKVLAKLTTVGIHFYQMSIDGLKSIHDYLGIRGVLKKR
jgi:MoaA/NifB/PqqE/SkfB family radical SAM enzyme